MMINTNCCCFKTVLTLHRRIPKTWWPTRTKRGWRRCLPAGGPMSISWSLLQSTIWSKRQHQINQYKSYFPDKPICFRLLETVNWPQLAKRSGHAVLVLLWHQVMVVMIRKEVMVMEVILSCWWCRGRWLWSLWWWRQVTLISVMVLSLNGGCCHVSSIFPGQSMKRFNIAQTR